MMKIMCAPAARWHTMERVRGCRCAHQHHLQPDVNASYYIHYSVAAAYEQCGLYYKLARSLY
jgi:hypothetical protein